MKKLLTLTLILVTTLFSLAQDFKGDWEGEINVMGTVLPLVLHIDKIDDAYSATMDSPKQQAFGIPVEAELNEKQELVVSSKAMRMECPLQIIGPDSLSGTFKQNGMKFPILLSRQKELNEEVVSTTNEMVSQALSFDTTTFKVDAGTHILAGEMDTPREGSNFPVAILISGTGAQDRNSTVFGHHLFLKMAEFLTQNGWAVVRFDERGVGQSTGDFSKATTHDLADDVNQIVNFIAQQEQVNSKKIVLIGHSEGGIIAPMVASRNENVSGFIALAGPTVKGLDLMKAQAHMVAESSGITGEDLINSDEIYATQVNLIYNRTEKNKDSTNRVLKNLLVEQMGLVSLPENEKDQAVKLMMEQWNSPAIYTLLHLDGEKVTQNVTKPALYLFAEKDIQVPAELNSKSLEKNLSDAQKEFVQIQTLMNHNHLFQICTTCTLEEYEKIEGGYSQESLDAILVWLQALKTL